MIRLARSAMASLNRRHRCQFAARVLHDERK